MRVQRRHIYPALGALFGVASTFAAQRISHGALLIAVPATLALVGWLLGKAEDRLASTSTTDPLTGLTNRRGLVDRLREEIVRSGRYHTPVALLVIDVDRLKNINDLQGHDAGDAALVTVADALRNACRASDLAARQGGDEFALLAPHTSAADALAIAERIHASLPKPLTVSIGIADVERAKSNRLEDLFAAADHALYSAKAAGRARAVIAPIEPSTSRQSLP